MNYIKAYTASLLDDGTLLRMIILASAGFVASSLFDSGFLLPLMMLCAGGGDCGCGGSCCGNSSGGGGGGTSTPFLCTWNGEKFEFENDVLFGKPSSSFQNNEAGKQTYEGGYVIGDLYRIHNQVRLRDGKPVFQIKEIEPEESYIDHLMLSKAVYPKDGELLVRSDFSGFSVFKKSALEEKEGVHSQRISGTMVNPLVEASLMNAAHLLSGSTDRTKDVILENGESIEISGTIRNTSNSVLLFLGSRYHDWSAGVIPELESDTSFKSVLSPFKEVSLMSFKSVARATLLVFLLAVMWTAANISGKSGSNETATKTHEGNDIALLAGAFRTPQAFADHRSLVIEYRNGDVYKTVDVVEPRYYQNSGVYVEIPREAVNKAGEVSVRVRATKRHAVVAAFLAAPDKEMKYSEERLKVVKAIHKGGRKNNARVVNSKLSGTYLETLPGDTIDIEFEQPKTVNNSEFQQEAYLLHASGYYVAQSDKAKERSNAWLKKLDPDSRAWLEEMYALRS